MDKKERKKERENDRLKLRLLLEYPPSNESFYLLLSMNPFS